LNGADLARYYQLGMDFIKSNLMRWRGITMFTFQEVVTAGGGNYLESNVTML
jgi:hypothetical protein